MPTGAIHIGTTSKLSVSRAGHGRLRVPPFEPYTNAEIMPRYLLSTSVVHLEVRQFSIMLLFPTPTVPGYLSLLCKP